MVERRQTMQPIELRTEGEMPPKIEGYSAVYYDPNQPGTEYVMKFSNWTIRERISPGAFDKVLNQDTYCLYNHEPSNILGNTVSRTCSLAVDNRGLRFSCNLPKTQLGNDVLELVGRGDLRGCSFAFDVGVDSWTENTETREVIREIREFKRLYDVGPVTYPAYSGTTVSARSELGSQEEFGKIIKALESRQAALETARQKLAGSMLQRLNNL